MDIVRVGPSDDPILIGHYLAIWESYGTPPEDYADDAWAKVAAFIEEGRKHGGHGGYIAIVDREIAGSVMCCLPRSPYPEVIKRSGVFGAISGRSTPPQVIAAKALAGR